MPHKHLPLDTPTGDEMKTTACPMRAGRGDRRAQLQNGKERGHQVSLAPERAA